MAERVSLSYLFGWRFAFAMAALALLDTTAIGAPPEAPDPGEEGWAAEVMSNAAQEQLGRLGQLLISTQPLTVAELNQLALLADECSCSELRPSDRTRIYGDEQFEVWRAALGARNSPPRRGVEGYLQSLQELRIPLSGADELRSSFKIYDVDTSEPQRPRMRVYFAMSGRTARGRVEQNADWIVRWKQSTSKPSLRLEWIGVDAIEEVWTRTDQGAPLFRDCSAWVFVDAPSFRQHLVFSQAYWRQRIEAFHVIEKSAQNGLAIGDVNGDGLDDVYVCQPGGLPNRLYLHQPDGSVRDVSAASGADILDNTRSALLVDFDNDGDQDLVLAVTSALLLFQNDGQGVFAPVKAIPAIVDAYSLAAADYDNDGDVDIYACRYFPDGANILALPIPTPYFAANNGGENFLVRNDGNWRTSNATAETGLDANNTRFSYAAIWIDHDGDGDQDLYVANDFGRNNLYRNDIGSDGRVRFTDVAMELGLEDGAFGMSASGGDFNRDGHEDIYIGNMFSAAGSRITRQPMFKEDASRTRRAQYQYLARGNTLFQNHQGGRFRDVSVDSGVTIGRWSWGSLFADINNDGWLDLLVANGYITGDAPHDDL